MITVNFDNWKAHCHYLGLLMTNPKGKSNKEKLAEKNASYSKKLDEYSNSANKETKAAKKLLTDCDKLKKEIEHLETIKDVPHLSTVCKTKLAEIFTNHTTGRTKDIKAKYLEKGLLVEEDAITDYALHIGENLVKNTEQLSNDFIVGTPDIRRLVSSTMRKKIVDTKASWDIFSFDAVAFKEINPLYEWQGDGYMWLDDAEEFELVYTLINTPKHLVEAEKNKLLYDWFGSKLNLEQSTIRDKELYANACYEIEAKHNYDDLPAERKIRIFNTVRDRNKDEAIAQRIKECRIYLNNFTNIKTDEDESDTDSDEEVGD